MLIELDYNFLPLTYGAISDAKYTIHLQSEPGRGCDRT